MIKDGIHAQQVFCGWQHDRYDLLDEWVERCEGATWDYNNGGRSYINGKLYYHIILFDAEEDLLVCKLTFPELLI